MAGGSYKYRRSFDSEGARENERHCHSETQGRQAHLFALMLSVEHILVSPPDEDIPARKKPRLQESLPVTASEADTLSGSPDASVAAPPIAGGRDPVAASPTQPNAGATWVPRRGWTPEADTKLTTAKATCKKKYGENYRTDWVAVAALVPGRTKQQCKDRWYILQLHSKSDETTARVGKWWTQDEDSTLEGDWAAISSLVSGRTKHQCWNRWHVILESKKNETIARRGTWTTKEDAKLKDAVEKHNGKDWAAISELVPGRTKRQCNKRRHDVLHARSHETIKRTGAWTIDEDSTLEHAVEKHNGENWAAISALVPSRTKMQCYDRWVKCQMFGPKSHHNHEGRT
jgi:hypothetical protein